MAGSSADKARKKQRDLEDHRLEAEMEDVAFLVSTGSTLERALERVGLTRSTYQKRLER